MERLEEKKRQEGGSKPGDLPLNPDDYARIIMLVEGVLDGYKKFWCYVAIKPSKYEDVRHLQTEGKLNLFKFDPYGELIISGEGVVPPLVVTAKVAEVYQTELLGFFGWADVAKVRQFLARHRPKVP